MDECAPPVVNLKQNVLFLIEIHVNKNISVLTYYKYCLFCNEGKKIEYFVHVNLLIAP